MSDILFAVSYRRRRWRFVPLVSVNVVIGEISSWDKASEYANAIQELGGKSIEIWSSEEYPGFFLS